MLVVVGECRNLSLYSGKIYKSYSCHHRTTAAVCFVRKKIFDNLYFYLRSVNLFDSCLCLISYSFSVYVNYVSPTL